MIKIMIVDDDFLIRTNIKYMIDWNDKKDGGNEFVFCSEANNGKEAISFIKSDLPDIIITDIKMPQMDGLELSSYIKSHCPQIKMLILSNYDDYEYVRGALKNGAIDYILKHKLNKETLMNAINRIREIIESESRTRSSEDITNLNMNNKIALKRNFIIQLLVGLYSENEIIDRIHTLDLNLQLTQALPIIMCVDDYRTLNLEDSNILEFSIINIADEILNDEKNGIVVHLTNEKYIIILSFKNIPSISTVQHETKRILNRILSCIKKFLNVSVSFFIGTICEHLSQISDSYKAVEENFRSRIYYENNSIITKAIQESTDQTEVLFDNKDEYELYSAIKINDTEKVKEILNGVFYDLESKKPSLSSLQMVLTDLLATVNRICKELSIDINRIYEREDLSTYMSDSTSLRSSNQWFLNIFLKLTNIVSSNGVTTNSSYVNAALIYIHNHYMDDISQSIVADKIGISNVYLSKLFKENLNMGFSEYLRNLRLEKAKILLHQGPISIKEVLESCGFNDYAYFFKVFKKKEGITPKEYIENISADHK